MRKTDSNARRFRLLLLLAGLTPWIAAAAPAFGQESIDRNAYFGDLHVHTSWSFDAYISNTRTTPDDAYRYGKGEPIPIAGGEPDQLDRPLDFMAVTDHAEFLGVFLKMTDPTHPVSKHPLAAAITSGDPLKARGAFLQITASAASGNPIGGEYYRTPDEPALIWKEVVAAADRHYQPGSFTTFPAFEWSSLEKFINLHRNIIFRSSEHVSETPYTMLESPKPEELWKWMEAQRGAGATLLAIPHNANMSKGRMYPETDSFGNPIDRAYAETRRRNEPVNEVIQNKGQSMTHSVLNALDEYADFESFNFTVGSAADEDTEVPPGSYAQPALQNGLALEESLGVNPFKFGFIGSSDSHNSNSALEEAEFSGTMGVTDPTPQRRLAGGPRVLKRGSGGLAGVWAEENTRESIYDALMRRETFATSGPRIRVQFFGGWGMAGSYADTKAMTQDGYAKGVPMGGDLVQTDQTDAPTFLVWAMKDPESANLDRIQIVKGWLQDGQTHERFYNVALSDGRQIAADGSAPGNGAAVDLTTGAYSQDKGDVELAAVWTDPEFDAGQSAYYFARVLENPTARWSTWDAIRTGQPLPEGVPATIRERAWSSPIWYSPETD